MKRSLMKEIWNDWEICVPFKPDKEFSWSSDVFKSMMKTETTFKELNEMLDDFIRLRNKYIGENIGNRNQRLIKKGHKFSFGIYSGRFHIWDGCGATSLGDFPVNEDEVPSQEFYDWVDKTTDEYIDGLIHCSCCDKLLQKEEVAGHYFAGSYCKDCWERKYKSLEANESYE